MQNSFLEKLPESCAIQGKFDFKVQIAFVILISKLKIVVGLKIGFKILSKIFYWLVAVFFLQHSLEKFWYDNSSCPL